MKTNVNILLDMPDGKVKRIPAKDCLTYPDGNNFIYELDKKMQYCFASNKYKMRVIDGDPCVGQILGSCQAVPIFGDKPDAPGEDYMLLMRTHGMAHAYRALKSDKKFDWKIIAIIAGVFVVAFLAWKFLMPKSEPVPTNPDGTPIEQTQETDVSGGSDNESGY
ncbi:MAG: hypothetical protein PHE50_00570 [Dehalococcoidales bacterium]|nr:hypothetical protein [Dehalococcoidales bacterium]